MHLGDIIGLGAPGSSRAMSILSLVQVAFEQLRLLLMQSETLTGIVDQIQLSLVLPSNKGALSSDQVSIFSGIC